MIEPIWIGDHPIAKFHPETEAKQMIFKCPESNLGLSVITAKGERWGDENSLGHGLYCSEELPYEALLIQNVELVPGQKPTADWVDGAEPYGWLSIEGLGRLLDDICENGIAGYERWNKVVQENR